MRSSASSHQAFLLPRCFSAALILVFPILLSVYQINREQKRCFPPSRPLIVSRLCCISHIVSFCYSLHYFRDRHARLEVFLTCFPSMVAPCGGMVGQRSLKCKCPIHPLLLLHSGSGSAGVCPSYSETIHQQVTSSSQGRIEKQSQPHSSHLRLLKFPMTRMCTS